MLWWCVGKSKSRHEAEKFTPNPAMVEVVWPVTSVLPANVVARDKSTKVHLTKEPGMCGQRIVEKFFVRQRSHMHSFFIIIILSP